MLDVQNDPSHEDIVYRVDRGGAWRSVAVYVALAAGCLLFHVYLAPRLGAVAETSAVSRALASVIGLVGFVGFGALGLIVLRRLRSSEPYLVISPRGFYDNASGMFSGAGWIDWSEVADVRLSRYQGLPCVELVPRARDRFMERFGWMERINRSARLGYAAVAIRGPLLPAEPAVLVEQMRRYWRRASAASG